MPKCILTFVFRPHNYKKYFYLGLSIFGSSLNVKIAFWPRFTDIRPQLKCHVKMHFTHLFDSWCLKLKITYFHHLSFPIFGPLFSDIFLPQFEIKITLWPHVFRVLVPAKISKQYFDLFFFCPISYFFDLDFLFRSVFFSKFCQSWSVKILSCLFAQNPWCQTLVTSHSMLDYNYVWRI